MTGVVVTNAAYIISKKAASSRCPSRHGQPGDTSSYRILKRTTLRGLDAIKSFAWSQGWHTDAHEGLPVIRQRPTGGINIVPD